LDQEIQFINTCATTNCSFYEQMDGEEKWICGWMLDSSEHEMTSDYCFDFFNLADVRLSSRTSSGSVTTT